MASPDKFQMLIKMFNIQCPAHVKCFDKISFQTVNTTKYHIPNTTILKALNIGEKCRMKTGVDAVRKRDSNLGREEFASVSTGRDRNFIKYFQT
jgi:hypothetical protein